MAISIDGAVVMGGRVGSRAVRPGDRLIVERGIVVDILSSEEWSRRQVFQKHPMYRMGRIPDPGQTKRGCEECNEGWVSFNRGQSGMVCPKCKGEEYCVP